jgi:hypothetical protein
MIPTIAAVVALLFAAHAIHHEKRPEKCPPKKENHQAGITKTEPCPKITSYDKVKRDKDGNRIA